MMDFDGDENDNGVQKEDHAEVVQIVVEVVVVVMIAMLIMMLMMMMLLLVMVNGRDGEGFGGVGIDGSVFINMIAPQTTKATASGVYPSVLRCAACACVRVHTGSRRGRRVQAAAGASGRARWHRGLRLHTRHRTHMCCGTNRMIARGSSPRARVQHTSNAIEQV